MHRRGNVAIDDIGFLAGQDYESRLDAPREGGCFYTAPAVARFITRRAFSFLKQDTPPSVCDPACGCGAFLLAAKELGAEHLCGADLDGQALSIAKEQLTLPQKTATLVQGESLLGIDWRPLKPEAGFDIVLTNPPYRNMVQMDAAQPEFRQRVREHYSSARGGFDLFVPFLQLALGLLRPGGILAALTPNKLLSSDYAQALRRHLEQHAELLAIADLHESFDAAVYPCVTFFQKSAGKGRRVQVLSQNEEAPVREVDFELREAFGGRWSFLLRPDAAELAEAARSSGRLADHAQICGAATVAEAYQWREALTDAPERPSPHHVPFLTSGAVRAGEHRWGIDPIRYLHERYARPWLDTSHGSISQRRRLQMLAPKVIVSGLARRPTALWMQTPSAAAKSTVILLPKPGVDGAKLAAHINTDEFAKLYAVYFESLALAGGYLRFGPRQLREIPIRGL